MKADPEFFKVTMEALKKTNPELHNIIQRDKEAFFEQTLREAKEEEDIAEVNLLKNIIVSKKI